MVHNPKLGRYMQPDPIGLAGGENRYAYVGGMPTMATDALGLCPMCVTGAIGGAIGAIAGGAAAWYFDSDISTGIMKGAIGGAVAGATFGAASGAIAGAGIFGEGVAGTIATGAAAGAVSGAAGNVAAQGAAIAASRQNGFSGSELALSTALGAGFGGAGSAYSAVKQCRAANAARPWGKTFDPDGPSYQEGVDPRTVPNGQHGARPIPEKNGGIAKYATEPIKLPLHRIHLQ